MSEKSAAIDPTADPAAAKAAIVARAEARLARALGLSEDTHDAYNLIANAAVRIERLTFERDVAKLCQRAADVLGYEVDRLVQTRQIDARSPAADALLDYVQGTGDRSSPDLTAFRARVEVQRAGPKVISDQRSREVEQLAKGASNVSGR